MQKFTVYRVHGRRVAYQKLLYQNVADSRPRSRGGGNNRRAHGRGGAPVRLPTRTKSRRAGARVVIHRAGEKPVHGGGDVRRAFEAAALDRGVPPGSRPALALAT